jgi:hypothetical protein
MAKKGTQPKRFIDDEEGTLPAIVQLLNFVDGLLALDANGKLWRYVPSEGAEQNAYWEPFENACMTQSR